MAVSLTIKAPGLELPDKIVHAELEWKIGKLKQHLSTLYPGNPNPHQQKLIYAGHLMADENMLKDVLHSVDEQQTLHLVYPFVKSKTPEPEKLQPSVKVTPVRPPNPSVTACPPTSSNSSQCHPWLLQSYWNLQMQNCFVPQQQHVDAAQMSFLWWQQLYAYNVAWALQNSFHQSAQTLPPVFTPTGVTNQLITQQALNDQLPQPVNRIADSTPSVPAPSSAPSPAQNQNPDGEPAAAAAENRANEDMLNAPVEQQMNAQGGFLDEPEDEFAAVGWDWLDWVYAFVRFGVLLVIVYFYSSISRLILVAALFMLVYIIDLEARFRQRRQPAATPAAAPTNQTTPPDTPSGDNPDDTGADTVEEMMSSSDSENVSDASGEEGRANEASSGSVEGRQGSEFGLRRRSRGRRQSAGSARAENRRATSTVGGAAEAPAQPARVLSFARLVGTVALGFVASLFPQFDRHNNAPLV